MIYISQLLYGKILFIPLIYFTTTFAITVELGIKSSKINVYLFSKNLNTNTKGDNIF